MKNKILLTVVTAATALAFYIIFSNFYKSKDQTYFYSNTSIAFATAENKEVIDLSAFLPTPQKKISNNTSTNTQKTSSVAAFKSTTRMRNNQVSIADNVPFDITTNQSSNSFSTRSNNKERYNQDDASQGGIIVAYQTEYRNKKSSNDNNDLMASVSSNYSSNINSTPSTFMGVPTVPSAPTDDIIIDPGGDPDPTTIIPVGNGVYIMIILGFIYFIGIYFKSKKA